METEGVAGSSSGVAEMLGRLKLTAEERDALTVDDTALESLATSDRAIIGKVLSSSVLHIQTIMSALRPAWGNPRGLEAKSVGDNMFIAEFGSKQDLDRVLDGSPWNVGKKAVLIQQFDPNMRPSDVVFNRLAVWIRIYNLPFGLMNNKWGGELAKKVEAVEKVEVDAQERAWGPYLRAKVQIDITKPLLRCVTIFSAKRQQTELYDVRYERLPNYCYSCGIIGHSSIECPTPADRDEKGLLPYGTDLRVSEDDKQKKGTGERQSQSVGRSFSSGGQRGSGDERHEQLSTESRGKTGGSSTMDGKNKESQEATSPLRRRGRRNKQKVEDIDTKDGKKELFPILPKGQGTKRKQVRNSHVRADSAFPNMMEGDSQDAMALIIAPPTTTSHSMKMTPDAEFVLEENGNEMAKKMKTQISTSDKEAAAVAQPRQEP
ncbi:hypothetical protein ACP70R_048143 [Stipagrostis hirtigluma subsp. patula]